MFGITQITFKKKKTKQNKTHNNNNKIEPFFTFLAQHKGEKARKDGLPGVFIYRYNFFGCRCFFYFYLHGISEPPI